MEVADLILKEAFARNYSLTPQQVDAMEWKIISGFAMIASGHAKRQEYEMSKLSKPIKPRM